MIDTAYLDELYECHGDIFLKEIIDLFVSSAPALMREIQQAQQIQAWDDLNHKAHKLKGMALSMSFAQLSQRAEQLEHSASEHTSDSAVLLTELESVHQQTQVALQVYAESRFSSVS